MKPDFLTRYRARRPGGKWVTGTGVKRNTRGLMLYRETTGAWVKIEPETLGRCTGRKDKRGTLIFEGDLVQTRDGAGTVNWRVCFGPTVWANGQTTVGFYLEHIGSEFERRYSWAAKTDWHPVWGACEIVGNIHDKRGQIDDDRRGESLLCRPGGETLDGPGEPCQKEGGRKDRDTAE